MQIGYIFIAVGAVAIFAGIHVVPEALRWGGYQIALMVLGLLMSIPLFVNLVTNAAQ